DQSSHYSFLLYQHTSRPEPYTLSLHDALPIWQLKRFDIKVKGAGSDPVEKFFRTADSAVLFPEYIARSVRQGMEEANLLPAITRSEEHTSELQSRFDLVCRLLLEKKKQHTHSQ